MSNPGHNKTFNETAERLDRDDQPALHPIMNTSREWDEAAAEARELDQAEAETTVNRTADTFSARIAETAPEIDPLVALETRRDSLQEAIRGLEFDQGNRENSASQNWKYGEEQEDLERELEEVEAQIRNMTSSN